MAVELTYRAIAPERGEPSWAAPYQRILHWAFLVCVVLMVSQYTVYRYGPAVVVVAPWGQAREDQIAYYAHPKEGVAPNEIQQPGFYVLNWATFDKVAYRLHSTTSIPPAELLLALLFLAATPLILARRLPWPRAPQWLLVSLAAVSLLGGSSLGEGIRELVQWGLVVIAAWWVAAQALVDQVQLRRLGRLLLGVTVILALLALREYAVYILASRPELPLLVRASLQSRSAYSGLMAVLLTMVFARALAAKQPWQQWALGLLVLIGSLTMLSAGGLVALYVGLLVVAAQKSLKSVLVAAVAAPLALALLIGVAHPNQFGLLRQSWGFYAVENTQRVGVEKRYLEMAAALNVFNGLLDPTVTKPGPPAEPGGEPQAVPVGTRSALVTGLGQGLNYQEAIGRYYTSLDNPNKQEPDTYTLYLLLACQIGLFGAVAWAWLLADGAALAGQAEGTFEGQAETRALAVGLRAALVAVAVFSLWGTLLVRGTGLLIFSLLAATWRLTQLRTESATVNIAAVDPRTPEGILSSESLNQGEGEADACNSDWPDSEPRPDGEPVLELP